MKINFIFCLLLLLTVVTSSCKKKIPNDSPFERASEILIGSTQDMFIDTNQFTFTGGSKPNSYNCFEFDVDSNGVGDLKICSGWFGSLGSGYYTRIKLVTGNSEVRIHGISRNDTTYFERIETLQVNEDSTITVNVYNTTSCRKTSVNQTVSIVNENVLHPSFLDFGSQISASINFIEFDGIINDQSSSTYPHNIISNDTIYRYSAKSLRNCNIVKYDSIAYIAFKSSTLFGERLGWIKFSFSKNGHVKVMERAIQI